MKIGLDATPIVENSAGIGNYVKELLKELVIAMPHVHFFLYVYRKKTHHQYWEAIPNVSIRSMPFLSFSHTLWLQLALPFFLKRDQVDLFWGTAQGIPLFLSSKIKTLLTLHDFVYLLDPKSMPFLLQKSFEILMPFMVKKAHFTLANSHGTATRLDLFYNRKVDGVLSPPIKTLFCPKKKPEVDSSLTQKGLNYKNYLLVVGTMEPRKRLENLLTLYEKSLKKNFDLQALLPLVIIGAGGWKNQALHAKLDHLSRLYPSHIVVLGFVSDLQLVLLMNGARALLMLSEYEGYGMPLAEARSCGTPIIATDLPEMREAAQEDGIFLSASQMETELPQYFQESFSPPTPTFLSYPSNGKKVLPLVQIIEQLAKREKL